VRHANQRRGVPQRSQRYFFRSLLQFIGADVVGFLPHQLGQGMKGVAKCLATGPLGAQFGVGNGHVQLNFAAARAKHRLRIGLCLHRIQHGE